MGFNPVMAPEVLKQCEAEFSPRHEGAICVANYKGGVGKTTLVCLLGYYLAEMTGKKVLLIDIDAQCSLSLAVGLDLAVVNKSDMTMYNLTKPTKWSKITKTKFDNYVQGIPDHLAPEGLSIIPGSFNVEDLDIEITKSVVRDGDTRINELFLYCKQMLNAYSDFSYILVDCPPNRMYLTQAMLRACSYYLPVTIPDKISAYGMPRLLRWVKQTSKADRPRLLGYVLNAINRAGGVPGGKVYSQQTAEHELRDWVLSEMEADESEVLGESPLVGQVPRLDVIAKFLSDSGRSNLTRQDFRKRTSGQPSVHQCMTSIVECILERIDRYNA